MTSRGQSTIRPQCKAFMLTPEETRGGSRLSSDPEFSDAKIDSAIAEFLRIARVPNSYGFREPQGR